jgi:hypothetical protein
MRSAQLRAGSDDPREKGEGAWRSAQLWELGASGGERSFALHDRGRKELDCKKGTRPVRALPRGHRTHVFCATRILVRELVKGLNIYRESDLRSKSGGGDSV